MPLADNGVYYEPTSKNEKLYEFENCYYLCYHTTAAIASIKYLMDGDPEKAPFSTTTQYYHYHTDHLLFAMGQIHTRFFPKRDMHNKKNDKIRESNRLNYQFNKDSYPILCEKSYRNALEHLEERNWDTIRKFDKCNGFNVIDDKYTAEDLGFSEYNLSFSYTLDLAKHAIIIKKRSKPISLSLDDLLEELLRLNAIVHSHWTYLTLPF